MRWSNDELKSTLHRVRAPVRKEGDGEYTKERYSIPWVCLPSFELLPFKIDSLATSIIDQKTDDSSAEPMLIE